MAPHKNKEIQKQDENFAWKNFAPFGSQTHRNFLVGKIFPGPGWAKIRPTWPALGESASRAEPRA